MAAPSGATTPANDAAATGAGNGAAAGAAKLSPAAKRVVEENQVDPKAVAGSGRDGRVSKSDVVNYLAKRSRHAARRAATAAADRSAGLLAPAPASPRARRARASSACR